MQTQCVRAGIVAIAVLSMGLGLCGRVARAVTPDAVLLLDGGALLADGDVFATGSGR